MPHRISLSPGAGKAGRALILSGLNYGTDRPLLALAAELLAPLVATMVRVDFGYASDPAFKAMDDASQIALIEADGATIFAEHAGAGTEGPLYLAGKSLGTVAMGGMLPQAGARDVHYLWLTPALTGTSLLGRMRLCPGPSFSLIGSRDPSVDLCRSAEYRGLPRMTHVEVAGADHGWRGPDGGPTEPALLDQARTAMAGWRG